MAENQRPRAADDFRSINLRLREIELESRQPASPSAVAPSSPAPTGKDDPAGFDVVCRQPTPEDLAVVDAGGACIAIRHPACGDRRAS